MQTEITPESGELDSEKLTRKSQNPRISHMSLIMMKVPPKRETMTEA